MAKTLPAKAPFEGCKIYGPYNAGKRQNVKIIREDGTQTTKDYARYRMSVKLGRKLGSWEWVDHIDNNPSNNKLSNLQLITPAANRTKDAPKARMVTLTCAHCGKRFKRRRNQRPSVKGAKLAFCDRSHSATYFHAKRRQEREAAS